MKQQIKDWQRRIAVVSACAGQTDDYHSGNDSIEESDEPNPRFEEGD